MDLGRIEALSLQKGFLNPWFEDPGKEKQRRYAFYSNLLLDNS